jgi:hypothetical protein
MGCQPKTERRQRYWVNSKVQWPITRLVLVSAAFCAMLAAILGIATGALAAARACGVEDPSITLSWLLHSRATIALLPVTLMAMSVGAFVWYGVHASHRIAGPLVPIQRGLARVREGDFSKPIVLRKDDWLREFADDLNQTFEVIKQRQERLEERVRGMGGEPVSRGNAETLAEALESSVS